MRGVTRGRRWGRCWRGGDGHRALASVGEPKISKARRPRAHRNATQRERALRVRVQLQTGQLPIEANIRPDVSPVSDAPLAEIKTWPIE